MSDNWIPHRNVLGRRAASVGLGGYSTDSSSTYYHCLILPVPPLLASPSHSLAPLYRSARPLIRLATRPHDPPFSDFTRAIFNETRAGPPLELLPQFLLPIMAATGIDQESITRRELTSRCIAIVSGPCRFWRARCARMQQAAAFSARA